MARGHDRWGTWGFVFFALGAMACSRKIDVDGDTGDSQGTVHSDDDDGCDREGYDIVRESAVRDTTEDWVLYRGWASEDSPSDVFRLEFNIGEGATDGSQQFQFSGENYSDCSTCSLLMVACGPSACAERFLAMEGHVDVSEMGTVGGDFRATVSDLVFEQVSLNPVTLETTPVPNGDTWCVDELEIDVEMGVPTDE